MVSITFKDVQGALKQIGIKKTIQEISDFFAQQNLDPQTVVLEDVVAKFQETQQASALAKAESPKGLSVRGKKALKKFEEKPQETPESTIHNKFHDIDDAGFQMAVQQVAETNFQKAVIFPQAVASRTHQLLIDPENQAILQSSIEDATTKVEQMLYGFNPAV